MARSRSSQRDLSRIAEGLRPLAAPLSAVRPDPANARRHPERNLEAIKASLARYGQRKPVVANRRTGLIEAGNGTWEAAHALGWTTLAVLWVEEDPTSATGYAIADNRTAELAEWDEAALAKTLRALRAAGEGLENVGFTDRELREVTDRLARASAAAGDGFDEAEALAAAPELAARIEPGQVWRLGRHLLACEDSTDPEAVHRVLSAGSRLQKEGYGADCVVTDPPYAIYGSSSGVGPDITDDKIVRPFFEALMRLCFSAVPTYGHAYVFCDWRSWPSFWEASKRAGMTARNLIVWDKGGQGLGSNYANCYELVGFFAKLPAPRGIGDVRPAGGKQILRPNMQRFPRPSGEDRQHMAAKPVGLYEEFIRNSTAEGETVLDPFMGSGTVYVAAERAGRRAVGIDVDPKWCAVAIARWEALTGSQAVQIQEGGIRDGGKGRAGAGISGAGKGARGGAGAEKRRPSGDPGRR